MKKNFRLKNLDCANCARKIEEKIGAMKEVEEVLVNFPLAKMSLKIKDENFEDTFKQVIKLINDLEPEVIVEKY